MNSPLHKSPVGLLELYRLSTLGRAPEFFGDTVVPVVDSSEFYGALNKNLSTSAPTVGAIGGAGLVETLALTGPIRLHAASAQLLIGAAAATNVFIRVVLSSPTAFELTIGEIFVPAVNIGAVASASSRLSRPVVLNPGWSVIARCWGTAAGADHTLEIMTLIDNITTAAP